jgi:hypothetical protein
LWFPYQIADDAWRASQPGDHTPRSGGVVIGWWICWLLAWFTGFYYRRGTTSAGYTNVSVGLQLGSNQVGTGLTAAAAILGALMVHREGRMRQARMTSPTS